MSLKRYKQRRQMDGRHTRYRHGDWNVLDQRTGFKLKGSETAIEWSQIQTRNPDQRNPQDFVPALRDNQFPGWVRGEAPDKFLPDVIDPENPYNVDFLATQNDNDIVTQDNQCIEIRTFGDFIETQDELLPSRS